jgi:hypothetical protein
MSRALSLAGFQVTIIGRFWVIAEGHMLPIFVRADGDRIHDTGRR